MNKTLERILSIPKSLYCSFRLCPRWHDAIKMPVMVRYNTVVKSLKGKIDYSQLGGAKTGVLHIGFGNIGIFDKRYSRTIIEINGTVKLGGKVVFGQGAKLSIGKAGVLSIGDKFVNTAEGTIICHDRVYIGENVLTSWYSIIMDTDFHQTMDVLTGEKNPYTSPIVIGNNVWLGMQSRVLKGCQIGDGCVIAAGSLCTKSNLPSNCVVAGVPAKIIKDNVTRVL